MDDPQFRRVLDFFGFSWKDYRRVRVGKYGVHLDALDQIAVPSVVPSEPDQIILIDVNGKMECLSPFFRETLVKPLDSPNTE